MTHYNTLGFYTDKSQRIWDRLIDEGANNELFRVFYQTNKVPAVQLIVTSGTAANLLLINESTQEVVQTLAMTVEDATTYKRLIYLGTTLTGNENGDYSLRVVIDGVTTYYSDVFGWTDGVSELLKISAVSGNIRLGKTYLANLTNFTFECYVNAEYCELAPEFNDKVSQQYGVNRVLYGNLIPKREADIYGNEYIYKFLLGLRILESNGTVTITWKGKSYTANDTMVEKSEEHSPDFYQLKFTFTDINEVISVSNENV